jgi:sugar (pentulose or hexulose) kinase
MARPEAIAVFDVGKSNAKLALVDTEHRKVLAVRTIPNAVLTDGPYRHFDVEMLWRWLIDGLAAFAREAEITVISTTTHGAGFAVTAGDALALPLLDYEDTGPDSVSGEYDRLRGAFNETFSPSLPGGLNAGRQLYWLSRNFPDAFARADAILPYPQYWVWRLTGTKVAEATSFGAHTDLWNPRAATFSGLAEREGWATLIPKLVRSWDSVGPVLPELARAAGLPSDCRVVAGIHDSNASLLPHILRRPSPFAVISSGTWMITFAPGGSLEGLDSTRHCLANVDAFTRPVPAAMCMAGREFDILLGGVTAEPAMDEIVRVVAEETMALPAFVPGSGPFGERPGSWSTDPSRLSPGARTAAASLYCALIGETCLRLTGSAGPILVEGPFARNRLLLAALAQLTGRPVSGRPDATGTTEGAALLAFGPEAAKGERDEAETVPPLDIDLSRYAAAWRSGSESYDSSPAVGA